MARQQRNARLQTREARRQLPLSANNDAYWYEVRRGLSLGYRKGNEGSSWWLREFKDGRYAKCKLGQADDDIDADGTTVLSWQDALAAALQEQRPTQIRPGSHTLADALSAYWAARRAKSPAESIYRDQSRIRAHLKPDLLQRDVNDLSAQTLRQFRDGLVESDEDPEVMRRRQDSANRLWCVVRACLNQAYNEGRALNPERWRRIKPFRNVDRPRTRFLVAAEARRALNAMEPDFRQLARGALYTGLRLGELLALRASEIGARTVYVRHSKSGKARTVPLDSEGAAFFEELTAGKDGSKLLFLRSNGQAWNRMDVSRRMAAASTAAKIHPPVKFHDLRRSYASLLINQGTDVEIIRELLGHADLRMTMRAYAHLMQKTIAKAVEKNLPSFGFKVSNVRKLRP